ncbi:hypothetical protein RvY_04498 [Ramazzottius varieornatus]|uniref:Uncharacterized protein n=1 Tax=Ramazzottius varieornatus TaxID=947166 RepID=A0A1D1UVD6_RAMVA|nr:hypothetical protein RvY_04498 [Ramazzottius varieornatus]
MIEILLSLTPASPKGDSEEPRTRRTPFPNRFAPEQHGNPCPLNMSSIPKSYDPDQLRLLAVTNLNKFSPDDHFP